MMTTMNYWHTICIYRHNIFESHIIAFWFFYTSTVSPYYFVKYLRPRKMSFWFTIPELLYLLARFKSTAIRNKSFIFSRPRVFYNRILLESCNSVKEFTLTKIIWLATHTSDFIKDNIISCTVLFVTNKFIVAESTSLH